MAAVEAMEPVQGVGLTGLERRESRTVTILDWDDTILASTFLQAVGEVMSQSTEVKDVFLELEIHALGLLEEAQKVGRVIVVTNAEAGWVETSAATLMPKVFQYITKNGIRIISARSQYGSQYPETPLAWKLCAFIREIALEFSGSAPNDVLVLGDGIGECIAGRELQRLLPETRVKIIKFVESPSVGKLIEQQIVIRKHLQYVANLNRSFEKRLP